MNDLYYEGPIQILEYLKDHHSDIPKDELIRLYERGLAQLKGTIEELKDAKTQISSILSKEDTAALATHDNFLNSAPKPLSPIAHAYKNIITADNLLYGFWEVD